MSKTVGQIIDWTIAELTPVLGDREARATARVVAEDALQLDKVDLVLKRDRVLEEDTVNHVKTIVNRVVAGEPVQYVLGTAYFHGIHLMVRPGVLIPRPETSMLVDMICDGYGNTPDLHVLDVGSGSGAISVSLARSLAFPQITAVDISATAIEVTRQNCNKYKLSNVQVVQRDVLTQGLPEGQYDIVVSNPPYVEENERAEMDRRVTDYEPAEALFVPDDNPLIFYRLIATDSYQKCLKPGGRLYFEINPRSADKLVRMLGTIGFEDISLERDFEGKNRFITALKPGR